MFFKIPRELSTLSSLDCLWHFMIIFHMNFNGLKFMESFSWG